MEPEADPLSALSEDQAKALEDRVFDRIVRNAFPWIAAAMLAFFLCANAFYFSGFHEIFRALRVDLPVPTNITLLVCRNAVIATLILAGIACFIAYAKRRALMIVFVCGVLATVGIEWVSVQLPMMKIQEALRKK